ncbi:hypothetical protein HZC00_00390 [Candidatus Kaiserbacteria bacterium]|nr:hypothetical protein [Candidatus Kaiserbacteria bacterium]
MQKELINTGKGMKSALLFHDPGQIDLLTSLLSTTAQGESPTVVAMGADVEFVLEKRSIPFYSARDLRRTGHVERLVLAEKLAHESFEDPLFNFFSHKNIHIGKIYSVALQTYLLDLIYFTDIVASLVEDHPELERVTVLPLTIEVPETGRLLAGLEARVVEIAAGLVCKQRNIEFFVEKGALSEKKFRVRVVLDSFRWKMFWWKRRMFGVALSLLNICVTTLRPRKKIRILGSDIWRNIAPLMDKLPEGELVLMDRLESFSVGLRLIWKHRMQFMHIDQFVSRGMHRLAVSRDREFRDEWERIRFKNHLINKTSFRGYSLTPVLQEAFERIISTGGIKSVEMIEGAHAIMRYLRPDVVLVRASASGQPHFGILCEVARLLSIPSLEVQHGIFYFGKGSYSNRRSVEYIAEYGPVLRESFKRIGYRDDQLFDVGSPRFDKFARIPDSEKIDVQDSEFVIACIMPGIARAFWTDHYEAFDFLQDIATAVLGVPNAKIILSMRGGADNEAFFREAIQRAFVNVNYRVAHNESLVDIFVQSDAIVSCHSTSVLEALISGRPTVYDAILPMHAVLGKDIGSDLDRYAQEGALAIAYNVEQLTHELLTLATSPEKRRSLVEGAKTFMSHNYSFDGKSSERLADVVRTLAEKHAQLK